MVHVCQICLGTHPAKHCRKGPNNWGNEGWDQGNQEGVETRPPEVAALGPLPERATNTDPTVATFSELFAGQAGLTIAVQEICAGWATARDPHDELFGGDLSNDQEFLAMVEEPAETTPDWKHMAPPCRTFTKARRKDKHANVKRLRSDDKPEGFGCKETTEANLLADRTAALGERQVEIGKWFSIENPEGSHIWELKSFRRLRKKPGVFQVVLHQCAYGAPWKKPTMLLTNCPWLQTCLKCEDVAAHGHTVLEGRVWSFKLDREVWLTSEAAEYPSGMCEAWAESWKEWLEKQPGKGGTESKTTEKKYAYKEGWQVLEQADKGGSCRPSGMTARKQERRAWGPEPVMSGGYERPKKISGETVWVAPVGG